MNFHDNDVLVEVSPAEMELDMQERTTKKVLYSTLQTRKLLKSASGMVLKNVQRERITADTHLRETVCDEIISLQDSDKALQGCLLLQLAFLPP